MSAPKVGLALIARNEEENLPHLLASIGGAFDEVVLLDTGSDDRTTELFAAWAQAEHACALAEGRTFRFEQADFGWCDDFAAARNAADAMLTTSWKVWADCDDTIHGADQLRQLAAEAPDDVAGYFFRYDYAQEPSSGQCICELWRERLMRTGTEWHGRVHEAQQFVGQVIQVDPARCQWVHRKPLGDPGDRNLKILEQWLAADPDDTRALSYLGVELAGRGRHEEAIDAYRRYLDLYTEIDEHRLQARRRLCASLLSIGRHDEVPEIAAAGMIEMPSWPDSYLSLAEHAYVTKRWAAAVDWAQQVLDRGKPSSILILNPLDYTFAPRVVLAGAHGALGDVEKACEIAEQALAMVPEHPELKTHYRQWHSARLHQSTVGTWMACVQMLIRHDEQAKALTLLEETCPYYIAEHPVIVAKRSELRERLQMIADPAAYAANYAVGAVEGVPDDKVAETCMKLPRAQFLVRQISAMTGVELIDTRLGRFRSRVGDHMAHYLTIDADEIQIEELLRQRVKPGMVVADIGANIGYFTRLLSQLVGEQGQVHAVEPDPTNVRFLRLNCPESNVTVHEIAASDQDAEVQLHMHPQNSGDNRIFEAPGTEGSVSVQARALEGVLPKLDVAVIDCQGVDHFALQGLGDHRPKLAIVELWPEGIGWAGGNVEAVKAVYADLGYEITPLGDETAGHWNLLLEATS